MTLVPLLLVAGALTIWYFTRELSALIMGLGFLPTLASLTQYWWGPSSFTKYENGLVVPDQSYLDLAQWIGHAASIGSTVSAIAFMVFAWRIRSYVKRPN